MKSLRIFPPPVGRKLLWLSSATASGWFRSGGLHRSCSSDFRVLQRDSGQPYCRWQANWTIPKYCSSPRGKVLEDKIQDKYRAHYHEESPKYDHSGQGHMDNLRGQPLRTFTEEGQVQRTIKKDRPPLWHFQRTIKENNWNRKTVMKDRAQGQLQRTIAVNQYNKKTTIEAWLCLDYNYWLTWIPIIKFVGLGFSCSSTRVHCTVLGISFPATPGCQRFGLAAQQSHY